MRFRIEQHFAGTVEEVEAAFLDPGYLDELSRLPKLGRPQVVHRVEAGDLVHLWVQYRFVGEVNSAVRRVVDPNRLTWIEESTLDRTTHRTTWRIVPDHYKNLLHSSGTFQLEPDPAVPGATVRVTDAELRVSIPLVGGKVERAILSGLEEHAAAEEEVMSEWLRTSHGP
jgi:hypothetical protein